ncbi:hypothetical protein ASE14_03645 [Agromyces sp. Root81]|uniref:DUF1697 domain-containing protein n=1 Tax=Agromyces sp. Root81 TaxID=1736601 RepID=UPI0006FECEF7|nr:DUF1697 domain-containing protein [Agromyces sp. Root81]KRC62911.1 hypothetical protein ASE14_03645 [Agromyces sp. Root81]
MTKWIALLRGVNVGGITIKSVELREVFDRLGFEHVRTVLASGNVAFDGAEGEASDALKSRIEQALRDRFDYEAWIVLVTREQLERVVEAFPFDASDMSRQPYVVFASDEKALDELVAAAGEPDPAADPISRGDGVLYWNPVTGTTLETPFAKLLGKPRYKPATTNRNLRTLHKLLA